MYAYALSNRIVLFVSLPTFQAHKPIWPNARRLHGVVEGWIGDRGRHYRRLRDDARIAYGKEIVYHVFSRQFCVFNCLPLSKRGKRKPY